MMAARVNTHHTGKRGIQEDSEAHLKPLKPANGDEIIIYTLKSGSGSLREAYRADWLVKGLPGGPRAGGRQW